MARKKRAGRPKGSKNKMTSVLDLLNTEPKRRGRPAGSKAKRRGRPAGIASTISDGGIKRKPGRPAGSTKSNAGRPGKIGGYGEIPTSINGIHIIGKSLIIDMSKINVEEIVSVNGKLPKVR